MVPAQDPSRSQSLQPNLALRQQQSIPVMPTSQAQQAQMQMTPQHVQYLLNMQQQQVMPYSLDQQRYQMQQRQGQNQIVNQ
jgi:hypothetical protein